MVDNADDSQSASPARLASRAFSRRAVFGLGAAGATAALAAGLANSEVAHASTSAATAGVGGDGDSGADLNPSLPYGYAGVSPSGTPLYDRVRLLTSKWGKVISITSGGGAGSTSVTLQQAPATLQPGQPVAISGGALDTETVYTASNYVAGANPVLLATPLVGGGRNALLYDRFSGHGPRAAEMTAFGMAPVACAISEGPNGFYTLMLGAASDQGPPVNTVMVSSTLVAGPTSQMDRPRAMGMAGDGLGVALSAQPSSTPLSSGPQVNSPAVITLAAVPGQANRLTMLTASYSQVPTGGNLKVVAGTTTVLDIDITADGPFEVPLPPGGITAGVGAAMTISLAAGGSAVVGKLSIAKLTA